MNRKLAAAGAAAVLALGMTLNATPAHADAIPIGSKRCGFWQDTSGFHIVFVTNCMTDRGAVIKVDRTAWPDPTYCIPPNTTKDLGDRGGAGPKSVAGATYLGPVAHC